MMKRWMMYILIPLVGLSSLIARVWFMRYLAVYTNSLQDYLWFNSLVQPVAVLPSAFIQYWGLISLLLVLVAGLFVVAQVSRESNFWHIMKWFGASVLLFMITVYIEHLALIWHQPWMFLISPALMAVLLIYLIRILWDQARLSSLLLMPYLFTTFYSLYFYLMILFSNLK